MAQGIVIGLDVGTTNIKAVALDERGAFLDEISAGIATAAPQPGWVEQDPEAIAACAIDCVRRLLAAIGPEASQVAGLGIANHTETLVVWDRETGRSVLPAIIWQCRRGGEEIEPLRSPENLALIETKTGLDLDPTFTASKLKWPWASACTSAGAWKVEGASTAGGWMVVSFE